MTTNADGQSILQGDGSWDFTATVNGSDLTVGDENITTGVQDAIIICTYFGGTLAQDPDDNGETASGLSTRGNPLLRGGALPMSGKGSAATQGSPLPPMPYIQTQVHVCAVVTGAEITIPVVDLGPSKSATSRPDQIHAIDLTRAAFVTLGGDLEKGWMHVRYRVIGGAHYVASR